MNNEKIKKIISYLIGACGVVLVFVIIYAFVIIGVNSKEQVLVELDEFINNSDNNIVYSILNYNFDEVNSSNISLSMLNKIGFTYNSEISEEEEDSLYKSVTGMSKSAYINSSSYVNAPMLNCYYNSNYLNKNYNCSRVCSNVNTARTFMMSEFKFSNVTSEDISLFCNKGNKYPIVSSEEIVVSLDKLKSTFNLYTNRELLFGKDITTNKFYKYNYLVTSNIEYIDNMMSDVKDIEIIKNNKNSVSFTYKAVYSEREVSGEAVFGKKDNSFYVMSNKIENANYLN